MRVRGILRVTRVTVRADENALLYGNADVVQNPDEVVNRRCLEGCGFVLTSERDSNFVARDPGRDQNVNFSLPLRFASQNGQLPSFLHANAWHLVHHRNQVFEDVSLHLVGHRLAAPPDNLSFRLRQCTPSRWLRSAQPMPQALDGIERVND